MNRKSILILLSIISIALLCSLASGVATYALPKNPLTGKEIKTIGSQLADMPALQSRLMKAYPSDYWVKVTNGHFLGIDLINSGLLDLSELERQAKAKEIAIFVKDNYGSMHTIDTITITFTERIDAGLQFSRFLTYVYYTRDLK